MRKDIYERMKLMKQDGIKPNYAELASIYNCDYRTIKKYYESHDTNATLKIIRPSKLDSYKELIKKKLEQLCKVSSIFYFIKKQGYQGGYTILKDFCKKYKIEQNTKATVRFETSPGLQAQVDWKENMALHSKYGEIFIINIFLTLLGYSRLKYIELTLDKARDTLQICLINSFKYYGGVPKEIIFDNMKTVVDRSKSNYNEVVINSSFMEFSKDMGFEIWTCRPFRPETKGKVENLAKIMERIKAFDYEFETLEDLETIVRNLNYDLNNEISQATFEKPFDRFKKEKEHLRQLPSQDIIDTYIKATDVTRIVHKDSLITFNNRKYSVDPKYIGKTVTIKITNQSLEIYFNKELIRTHQITNKIYNYSEDDYVSILSQTTFKTSSDEEIKKIAINNLKIYDSLGE